VPTQAVRDCVADYLGDPFIREGRIDHYPLVQAINSLIREAIEADRRGRTFSPTELDKAREEGVRMGLEAAVKIVQDNLAFGVKAHIIRAIRAFDPAAVQRGE
jgi:hypothetical protein